MNKESIRFLALGGLGHVGANMMLVESEAETIAIDCGVKFADDDFFNLNFLTANFKHIHHIDALVITHGHEDHIGAISVFLDYFPKVKIFAPPFAFELIELKLAQSKKKAKLIKVDPEATLSFKQFDIDYIHVNHSIPHTYGLSFSFHQLNAHALFVSDFKIDHHSPYEEVFDFEKLKKISNKFSSKILFADSTNILSSSMKARSERELIADLTQSIREVKGRVFIPLFSSNVHRLKTLHEIARKLKLPIIAYGASIHKYLEVALNSQVLPKSFRVFDPEDADCEQPSLVLLTGCQGDFKGALKRVSSGQDRYFKLSPQDRFVMSSKTIPGNEKKVAQIFNDLALKDCEILLDGERHLHATGHACKEDLLELYQEYKPTHIVPIHGEYIFLNEHRRFVESSFKEAKPVPLKNGEALSLLPTSSGLKIRVDFIFEAQYLYFHGSELEIDKAQISQRRKLAQNGLLVISATSSRGKESELDIQIENLGLPEKHLDYSGIKRLLGKLLSVKNPNLEEIKISLRQLVAQKLGYKPQVVLHFFSK